MSSERIQEHLTSDAFHANIRALSAYSIQHRFEGGIAAYTDGSQRVYLPDVETVQQISSDAHSVGDAFAAGYNSLNLLKLVRKEQPEPEVEDEEDNAAPIGILKGFRDDIDLLIHSHPVNEWQTARERLCPSPADLESWEQTFDLVSPGITEGVLAPTTESTKLLLWRKDPDDYIVPRYQLLEGHEAAARVIRVMKESGLHVATLDMSLSRPEYADQRAQVVEELF
jgi:hypothetical protein